MRVKILVYTVFRKCDARRLFIQLVTDQVIIIYLGKFTFNKFRLVIYYIASMYFNDVGFVSSFYTCTSV